AMEKFNLTRDQLYHYAKYHNIPKVKKGKYTLISKPELDKLLAAPKIE
ncbi:DNA-binding protein, partial [Phocaeicola vulgatus]|nr:DNA-binding protein [Phocaeicola vulgatus]